MAALGTIRIRWNGVAATAAMRAAASKGIRAVVDHAKRLVQDAVSESGGHSAGLQTYSKKSHGPPAIWTASQPGNPPFARTGKGRQSIFGVMTASTKGRVGTNLAYMAFLELGVSGGATISATRKKCLCFPGFIGGVPGWICRKSVTQGPIAKRPWLVKTITDNITELQQVFEHTAHAAFEAGARAKL